MSANCPSLILLHSGIPDDFTEDEPSDDDSEYDNDLVIYEYISIYFSL